MEWEWRGGGTSGRRPGTSGWWGSVLGGARMAPMPDESPAATSRCPWCSTSVPAGTEVCPSCGAALIASADGGVPGLTAIDAEAVLRSRSQQKSRGGLLGFLSGETGDTVDAPSESELASLAPPDANVRMEMLRLEIEAE